MISFTKYIIKKQLEKSASLFWKLRSTKFLKLNHEELKNLKNKFSGQRCFIIGNGPSINKMNLNLLKNEISFACNSFFLKYPELVFKPTIYTVEDPLPAEDNKDALNSLEGSIKIIPYDLHKVIIPDKNTIYINFLRSYMHNEDSNFPMFSKDMVEQIFWGGTVVYMNIQLAALMGCNPIYLIGVDLSYQIPKNIKQDQSVLTSVADDPNHFDPRYFGEGKRWHLPEVDRMQRAFFKAYTELEKQDVKLVNATVGGNLQNIPRVLFDELF